MNTKQQQRLIAAALAVRLRAHAPYSEFLVGAAVLVETGEVFAGCNVENASYGLTICAERSAVVQAVAAGKSRLVALAVASKGGVSPCGACRQVLAEFADDLPVLLIDAENPGNVLQLFLRDLLPHRFGHSRRPGSTGGQS
jgi:cytidine deaminase